MTIPEVEEVLLVTGDVDMLVRARVRDHTHLRDLLMQPRLADRGHPAHRDRR